MCDSLAPMMDGLAERVSSPESAVDARSESTAASPTQMPVQSGQRSRQRSGSTRASNAVQPFAYNEAKRLAAVLRFNIRDTPAEATAAAEICQVPAALITVLDHESTWFKSNLGFGDATHTQRNITLCDHVIRSNELLIIEDLTKDARFKDNPFVTAPPHMRFYAGAPLIDPESGQAIGSLCVIDFVPRIINDLQKQALRLLARQVMSACESRLRIIHLEEALLQLEETRGALKASKEQAERAQKQAEQANLTKSEFLANMSHEIRTPLNGVLGTASLLAETTRLDFEQRDYVRVIQSSGEHLLIVLNDILDFSKFESGKLEIDAGRVDLQSMLEQAIELSFKPKPTLELVYEIGADVPATILGDVTRLRQIVANLISNASKFCTRGEVSVKVQRMTPEEIAAHQGPPIAAPSPSPMAMSDAHHAEETTPVHHHYNSIEHSPAGVAASSMQLEGPMVVTANVSAIRSPLHPVARDAALPADSMMLVFSVSDTGIGIEAGKIHKLFSAFTQLDISITREYGGTGLGLAISARLAQLMGGTMWVKSEVGKGSTFFFSIRTRPQPTAVPSRPSNPPSPSHSVNPSLSGTTLTPHPLAAEFPAWSEIPSHLKVAAHHEGRMHVMVVEPNSHLLLSIVVQLRKWGFTPLPYSSCSAAKAALQERCVIDHQLAAIIISVPACSGFSAMTQTFNTPTSTTRTLSNSSPEPSSASIEEEPYLLVDSIRALDRERADGSYGRVHNSSATNSMDDDVVAASSVTGIDAGYGSSGNLSPTSTATSVTNAPTSDTPAVVCPDEYVIPCIILLPTELEDEPSAAATFAAARTAFVRARRCNPLHKPVLWNKLARKLDKVFRFALYGEDPYPNTSGVVPGSMPSSLSSITRGLYVNSGPLTPDSSSTPGLPPFAPNSIPHSTPMRSRVLAQHIPNPASALVPNSASAGSSPQHGPVSRQFSVTSPLRILVVEDNSVNMKLVLRMLTTLGYSDLAQAWNGQEAVDRIVRDGRQFDLVLMDHVMPLLTGPQACRLIMNHYRTVLSTETPPVVISMTASCMESDKLEAKQSGHSDFLPKPLSLPTLKAKLQQWAKTIQQRAQAAAAAPPQDASNGRSHGALFPSSTATSPAPSSAASVSSATTEMES